MVHAHRELWPEFRKRYLQELRGPGAKKALSDLGELLSVNDRITLLFASKEADQNNAAVLKEAMEGTKKPPHSASPSSARTRARKSQPRR